jgi:hypothetical protein
VGLACDERYDVQTRTYVQGWSRVSRQTAGEPGFDTRATRVFEVTT